MNTKRTAIASVKNTGGDYMPKGVVLQSIYDVVETKDESGQVLYRSQFFNVRKENSFTDDNGVWQERQPLDISCTTFDDNVMSLLASVKDKIQDGVKLDLTGYLEPSWRGYIADNSPDGDRFVMPDLGRDPIVSDKGQEIQPSAHPYLAERGVPNFICYDQKQLRVNIAILTTAVDGQENVETTAVETLGNVQSKLNQATGAAPEQQQNQVQQSTAPPNPNAGNVNI